MKTQSEDVDAALIQSDKTVVAVVSTIEEEDNYDIVENEKKRLKMHIVEPDEEEEMWEKKNERKQTFTLPPRPTRGTIANETKSTFHGAAGTERDYQGRPWTTPPAGVHARNIPVDERHESFIPKKCIKKYTGHTKGVQQIQFIPKTGHLLLSASMDGKCKIWDVAGDRNVKRTYIGHSEAVRSIDFNTIGSQFVSSGYDRYVRVWDVETGVSIGTYSNRKMGYEVRFSPSDPNLFLMAASDNKIYQWDVREGSIVQEYNYHLQPCNTVTFFGMICIVETALYYFI
jgi:pre-mRNA-processing factor 17